MVYFGLLNIIALYFATRMNYYHRAPILYISHSSSFHLISKNIYLCHTLSAHQRDET